MLQGIKYGSAVEGGKNWDESWSRYMYKSQGREGLTFRNESSDMKCMWALLRYIYLSSVCTKDWSLATGSTSIAPKCII